MGALVIRIGFWAYYTTEIRNTTIIFGSCLGPYIRGLRIQRHVDKSVPLPLRTLDQDTVIGVVGTARLLVQNWVGNLNNRT